ncbi:MAG TPA: enoyl-CoA hydratase-related protein [Myxococcota bacterium]
MAGDALVRAERRGAAAWIALDSPANRNALSAALVDQLTAHLDAALRDDAVRCVVLTGTGSAFCAGADLKGRGAGLGRTRDGDSPFVGVLKTLWNGPKPVIAAVNGHAFGGGIGLVAACDIAVAVETAKFAFSEVRVGVVPATISVLVIPKLGVHQSMRLFLTGERFEAQRALEYGLLHRVVAPDALERAVQEEVDAIARGGPNAVREAKRLVREVPTLSMDEAFRRAEALIGELFASPEAAEGAAAFLEKRPPRWSPQK